MYLSNPMVSVIVPVYNAESTLRRCADSILEQSYPDLELIWWMTAARMPRP